MPSPTRNRVLFLAAFSAILMFLFAINSWHRHYGASLTSNEGRGTVPRRTHVVVASEFTQHFDVYLAAVNTISQVLGNDGNVQVFAHKPLLHGFEEIVGTLDLYDQEMRHPDELVAYMDSDINYTAEPGKMPDLLLFGTCEVDMRRWSDELLEVWDARPADQKFIIVCIVHHFRDVNWQKHISAWARRRSIRLLPIGYHVGHAFRSHFLELADSIDVELYEAMYEYIDIDVHAPVLNLPDYVERPQRHMPTRVVIQGNLQADRRDYPHIFADLLEAIELDPGAWGYKSLARDRDIYEPLSGSDNEAFELHLIGEGRLDIPKALSRAVFTHNGLNYTDFYTLMQTMDVVIPAFVNVDYYDNQASSTVAMAVECNVPILSSRRMRDAYGYIDDDRVTITRPQALREIHAISFLRNAYPPELDLHFPGSDRLAADVDAMLKAGWRRSQEDFNSFKEELWGQNRAAIMRILEGRRGII